MTSTEFFKCPKIVNKIITVLFVALPLKTVSLFHNKCLSFSKPPVFSTIARLPQLSVFAIIVRLSCITNVSLSCLGAPRAFPSFPIRLNAKIILAI